MPKEQEKSNIEIGQIKSREITEEMKDSYIDYAMSVIVSRALPDVRDGLKPVQRRILYAMYGLGLNHTAKFRKSAAVTGEVLGKYHPHGDIAVYDALARMAQDFTLRYPLVQGQGNFGCFTKDTKIRLVDGRDLTFGELIKETKQRRKNYTFTFNPEKEKIEIAEIKKPRLTRKKERILEITLDNDEKIKCTLDHRFMLRNGSYKEAKLLMPEDSLMPLNEKLLSEINNYNNHKIIKIKILQKREDVYDLTTEPWHNFALTAGVFVHNSVDGDPPAAQRYTEARLSKVGEETLKDIGRDTVNFQDNYDGTRKEPIVLPSPLPQLLLNGSLGIAVGMATNIPPHNLSEVCQALIYLVDRPKVTTEDLFQFIKGPDFPGGGTIYGKKDIIFAYSQGKGPIVVRGKAEIKEKEKSSQSEIVISEIPFQVQKSSLIEQFAKLVQDKKIQGVKDIRDESDKEGMRIVIDIQRDAYPQKILNRIYKFTDLQRTFHLNMLALVDGIQPKVLSLVDVLSYFINHRKEVITRRTKYDLERARERAHILEGLHKCLSKIDAVIKLIKSSKNREEAQKNLMKKFRLTAIQAIAILETKLASLAKLERKKIEEELLEIEVKIKKLTTILKSPKKIEEVLKKELEEVKENFGDERRTKVYNQEIGEIAEEDLIPQEETIITLTQGGYIKRINPVAYKLQRRGGKGILGMKTLGDDIIEHFLLAQTHDNLFFFTDSGKVFRTLAYEIPEGTRVARGRGILNFLEISPEEKVLSLLTIGKEDIDLGIKNLLMVTKNGIIKKTALREFKNVRRSGLIAINLRKDDFLKKVAESAGQNEIILVTQNGQSIRFREKEIREMGRPASGIRGIRLKKGDEVIGMDVIKLKGKKFLASESKSQKPEIKSQKPEIKKYLLVVAENGYGKRTNLTEYKLQGRGGSGIKTAKVTPKTGKIVFSIVLSGEEEDLIVISQRGQVIRAKVSEIPVISRATQGVKIMRLDQSDRVASAMCI